MLTYAAIAQFFFKGNHLSLHLRDYGVNTDLPGFMIILHRDKPVGSWKYLSQNAFNTSNLPNIRV